MTILTWPTRLLFIPLAMGYCINPPTSPLDALSLINLLPATSQGVTFNKIGEYNGSVDVEFPYVKNYTSFKMSVVIISRQKAGLQLSQKELVFMFPQNKGTFYGIPKGSHILKFEGLQDGCPGKLGNIAIVSPLVVADSSFERIEIQNFKVLFTLDDNLQVQSRLSWDGIKNAKDYLVTWRQMEDCLPNESSMVTNKTHLNIVIGSYETLMTKQLADNVTYVYTVRVNSSVTTGTSNNKPIAQPIILPIKFSSFKISLAKRKADSVQLFLPLELGEVSVKVNGTVYNFLSPGNIEIKGLSAKTNYKALVYKLNGEFQNKIYIETIYFKTASFLHVNVVCTDSSAIVLEWENLAFSNGTLFKYEIKYNQLGEALVETTYQSTNETNGVSLTCLKPNTTYSVTVKIEGRPEDHLVDHSKPVIVTTGSNETDLSCQFLSQAICSKSAQVTGFLFCIQLMAIVVSVMLFN